MFWYICAAALLLSCAFVLSRRLLYSASRAPARRYVERASHPYGISESIGRRAHMEDRHVIVALPALPGGALLPPSGASAPLRPPAAAARPTLYGVFDGHAGAAAAEFCAALVGSVLASDPSWPSAPAAALTSTFLALDARFLELARAQRPPLDDGTTACVALALGARLYVANAGDSRAVLVQRSGRALPLSDDHKPNRPDEVARIKGLGGSVYFHGVWRVDGVLAVSRAIGDRPLKPYVCALPEVQLWNVEAGDLALVLASDGLWDALSNEQVAAAVCGAMGEGAAPPAAAAAQSAAQRAAASLVRHAILAGSADNVTCLVVDLREAAAGNGGGGGGDGGGGGGAGGGGGGAGGGAGAGGAAPAGSEEAAGAPPQAAATAAEGAAAAPAAPPLTDVEGGGGGGGNGSGGGGSGGGALPLGTPAAGLAPTNPDFSLFSFPERRPEKWE
jgi:protein phosphatase 1L